MQSLATKKLPNKNNGFTVLELLIAMAIILVLIGVMVTLVVPAGARDKARDTKRLTSLSTLERAIIEYSIDNGEFPGTADVTLTSTSLPAGQVGPYENIYSGWIDDDLSDYTSKLPIDPVNDETYHFIYRHTSTEYEIDATLEYFVEKMQNDGGDNDSYYEIGNSLELL